MSYRLRLREPVPDETARMTREQIDIALNYLEHPEADHDKAVHEARKCFKKIRGILRLIRDDIGKETYQRENVCFRDAGRRLAAARDSAVRVETLDHLTEYYRDQVTDEIGANVREILVQLQHEQTRRLFDDDDRLDETIAAVQDARDRMSEWDISADGFAPLAPGLKRVYKRGRKGLKTAYAEPTAAHFHEWRKRVKYLWYHLRILRPVWPRMCTPLSRASHQLAGYLGEEHDLAQLRHTLSEHSEVCADSAQQDALLFLITRREEELRQMARPLGERLYVEKPSAFVRRMAGYWDIARAAMNGFEE